MKVVKPIEITEAVFTASSVAEPDLTKGEVEWQSDVFDGYNFDQNVTSKNAFDAIELNGSIFVVEGKESLTEGLAYIHRYETDGSHTGSFQIANRSNALISKSHLDDCVAIVSLDDSESSIYNISTNTKISDFNISGEIAFSSGIAFDGFNYFILDGSTGKIKRFDTSFVYDGFEIDAGLGLWGISSLKFIDGKLSIFNQKTNSLVLINIDGTKSSEVITSNSITYPSECYGHFYLDGSVYPISNQNSLAYKYTNGVYAGLYQVGERVIKTSTHKLYECAIATGLDPEVGVNNIPQEWVEVGPTNKWAIFDDKKSTPTVSSSPYSIQLVPGVAIDSMAATNISGATEVQIIATSASAGEVYNRTIQMLDIDSVTDFYNYFSYQLEYVNEFTIIDIPIYNDLTIDITFTGSEVSVGRLATGRKKSLGELLVGASSDRIDYSRSEFDEFGELTYVARPIVKYSTYPVAIEKKIAPSIERYLDSIKGVQAVWVGDIGNDQFLTTFGAIERSPLVYDNLSIVEYQIKVRGSI